MPGSAQATVLPVLELRRSSHGAPWTVSQPRARRTRPVLVHSRWPAPVTERSAPASRVQLDRRIRGRAAASAAQMISRRLSASGRPYPPWRSAWCGAIRGGKMRSAGSGSLAGLWVVVFGGTAGRPGPGRVSEAVRGPSVKTSGDDGLVWDQGAVTGVRGLALLRSATWAGGPTAPAGTGLIREVGRDAEDR